MFQKLSFARLIMILTLPTFLLKLFKIEHAFVYDSFEFLINVIRTMLQRGGRREDLITLLKEAHVRDEDLKNMNFDKLTASSGKCILHELTNQNNIYYCFFRARATP